MTMAPGCLLLVVLLAFAVPAGAQSSEPSSPAAAAAPATRTGQETRPRHPTRLYLGMWTKHLKERQRPIASNWLVGISYRGFFGGTFMNSFGKRAYAAGLQREFAGAQKGPFAWSLGYRLGAVSGYDGRFMKIARDTPVLPMLQVFTNLDYHRVGMEASYTILVTSVALSYRF